MVALLAFATVLLLAVLISELAHRSVLSTAALFLAAGFLLGEGVLGVLHFDAERPRRVRPSPSSPCSPSCSPTA